ALGLAGPSGSTAAAGRRLARSNQAAAAVDPDGPISESETAFLAKHGQANARAAQRRPGAKHQARPGLPESAFRWQELWFYPRRGGFARVVERNCAANEMPAFRAILGLPAIVF